MDDSGQSLGGQRRAEVLTADERADIARRGARAIHTPAALARRIVRAWPGLDPVQRDVIREILRDGGVIKV